MGIMRLPIQNCGEPKNPMLLHALVRVMEIIGEAASRISEKYQDEHPEIPWKRMIGMRNHLIHGYFTIDSDVIWDTATTEIPELIETLRKLHVE